MDYKKYSLENLENWMHDALSCSEATPQEIYDVIKNVVDENYCIYKNHTERCYELLALLNGNGNFNLSEVLGEREYYEGKVDDGMRPWGHSDIEYQIANNKKPLSCDKDDPSPECQKSWNDFWGGVDEKNNREYNLREAEYYNKRAQLDAKRDKVKKWRLPVEQSIIDGVDDYYVQFPDDLLEAANLREGDSIEWVDQGDGSYLLKKV